MIEFQILSLLCITMAAVLDDLRTGKISNGIVVTGILWGAASQLFLRGAVGGILFLGGICLPAVLFAAVFYFRMIGAGDIKLMCVVGGFLGPSDGLSCIVYAILFGAVISLVIMVRRQNINQRLICFFEYFNEYSKDKKWKSYLDSVGEEAKFCFSVPVLCSVICYIGGNY